MLARDQYIALNVKPGEGGPATFGDAVGAALLALPLLPQQGWQLLSPEHAALRAALDDDPLYKAFVAGEVHSLALQCWHIL